LRVIPGARHPEIVGRHGESWKVRVTAPAEGGRANDAVLELLARALEIPRRDVSLAVGASSRDKVVVLDGLTHATAEERLAAAAGGAE
jgi:uncharacterized protein YggU (UPF0235/DUF167 family)